MALLCKIGAFSFVVELLHRLNSARSDSPQLDFAHLNTTRRYQHSTFRKIGAFAFGMF